MDASAMMLPDQAGEGQTASPEAAGRTSLFVAQPVDHTRGQAQAAHARAPARARLVEPLVVALPAEGPGPPYPDVQASPELHAEVVLASGDGDVEHLQADRLPVEAEEGVHEDDGGGAAQEGEAGPSHEIELAPA